MPKNVGIYWGTFDPPTLAHLNIMLQAIEQGELDKLVVVINNKSGYKHYHTPGVDRLIMIRQMLLHSVAAEQINIVIQNDTQKYGVEEISQIFEDDRIIPVVGQDSFEKFAAYCKQYSEVIVAPRGDKESLTLQNTIHEHELDNIRVLNLGRKYLEVSSSRVREEVNAHESPAISSLVTSNTGHYIEDHRFFKEDFHAEHHSAARTIQRAC